MVFKYFMVLIFLINSITAFPKSENVVIQKAVELPNSEQFVVAHWDQNSKIPENAIEIEPSHHEIVSKNPHKKLVAIPVDEIQDGHEVLTDDDGKAVVASVNSNEDLMTAESIVFRPLFVYRRKLSQRRRGYVPSNYVRRNYYPSYTTIRNGFSNYRYPIRRTFYVRPYYHNYYRHNRRDGFPALT